MLTRQNGSAESLNEMFLVPIPGFAKGSIAAILSDRCVTTRLTRRGFTFESRTPLGP